MQGRIAFIGGGARSGKSRFALQLARTRGERRVFIATAQPLDGEMHARIAAHRATRGDDFRTIEEPIALPQALAGLADECDVVVIDCLTLWLTNLLLRGDDAGQIEAHVGTLADVLARRAFHVVVVSNEVGLGLVPPTALGRAFCDLSGLAHQRLAAISDDVYWALLGCVLRVRPEPVALERAGAEA
jgi:adenosylcobinamide kinase/adenosylcobinamide-phosphate guanylyltransferase